MSALISFPANSITTESASAATTSKSASVQSVAANSVIKSKVDNILAARRENLPAIDAEIANCNDKIASRKDLGTTLKKLVSLASDKRDMEDVSNLLASVKNEVSASKERKMLLVDLKEEFSRNTLNIGVSGEARVGKSLTLQGFTGLTDEQIPTGSGLPVTAVRSEVYNDARNCAEIEFRTESEFIRDFVQPHLDNVNEALRVTLSVHDMSSFHSANFNIQLGGEASNAALNSLTQLQNAQKDISSFEYLLGSGTKEVSLDGIRQYVAYPTDVELHGQDEARSAGLFGKKAANQKPTGQKPVNRAYLAVKNVRIYNSFPNLGNVAVGLVDLPGLGEVGPEVANAHLRGLQSKVDQIVLIARPTESEGYFKKGLSDNIDNLRSVQPGVTHRNDLITIAMNVEPGAEESAKSLRHDIDDRLNANLNASERYEVLEYNAGDATQTSDLLMELLDKLVTSLPEMDKQKLAYATDKSKGDPFFAVKLKAGKDAIDRMLRSLPRAIDIEYAHCQEVSSKFIDAYCDFEVELSNISNDKSEAYQEFCADVERIYDQVKRDIENGFFLGSRDAWEKSATGQPDYYNFYRQECKRMRSCIVDAYSGLDAFYGSHVDNFKHRALGILLEGAGNLGAAFDLGLADSENARIDVVASGLSSRISCEDALSALNLLRDVDYGFRSNVFLLIENHLSELFNPCETFSTSAGKTIDKRDILGSVGATDKKLGSLHSYMKYDATAANNAIKKALLNEEDCFNRYLSNSLSFFCDHLFRRDVEAFKGVFVRGLVTEFADVLYPKHAGADKDAQKLELLKRAQAEIDALSKKSA